MKLDYDIVVIGAGIHGTQIFRSAIANGYSCLLVEQDSQVAGGASGYAGHFTCGSLRYLEQGNIKLAFRCLRERNKLLRTAPEMVSWHPFYLPVYRYSGQNARKIRFRFVIYYLLSLLNGIKTYFYSVKQKEWKNLHGIKQKGLTKVFCYKDIVVDTPALTRNIVQSALTEGGDIRLNTQLKRAVKTRQGYQLFLTSKVKDDVKTISLSSRAIVHATGPWISSSLNNTLPNPAIPSIELLQASSIVMPGNLQDISYRIEAPDDRWITVIPDGNGIRIGTTEMVFRGDPTESLPTPHEINYLLGIFNYYFPNFYPAGPACASDIVKSCANIHVLLKSESSRQTQTTQFIYDHKTRPRLIGICGGKPAFFLATSDLVLHKLRRQLPKQRRYVPAHKISL